MKSLSELTKSDIADIRLVCFDCDGVTVKRGTEIDEDTGREKVYLKIKTNILAEPMRKKLELLKKRFHVTFSSGRSLIYLEMMYGKILWEKASLQGENGIFTLIDGQVLQHEFFDPETLKTIQKIKNEIRRLDQENADISGFEPKQFLISVHCCREVKDVYDVVKRFDRKDEFYCWWNGEAFDISLKRINKGTGLKHLADYLKVPYEQTMAIGNGINDKDMIDAAGIGVTTDPENLKADFHTSGKLHLGGEELIDKLLELI